MKLMKLCVAFIILGVALLSFPVSGQTPVVSVTPDNIQVTSVLCDDSITVPLQIHNNGTGPLFYSVLQVSNFYDNFENGLGNWNITSHWGLQSPGHEGEFFLTESPGGGYGNGWNDYISLKDSLVIALKDSAKLSFYLKYSLECGYDYLYVQISVNNGNWQSLQVFNCPSTGWTLREYNLSSYVNEGDYIKIRYYFHSDGSVTYDGVGIDEVTIRGVGNTVPWISYPAPSGVVMPGFSETFNVAFTTDNLITGIYNHQIILLTNDPASPQVFIPATLDFTGYPIFSPLTVTHDFGSLFVHAFNIDTLQITNTGCDTLKIFNISTSQTQFEVLQTQYNILPGKIANIPVRFEPDAVGQFTGDVFFDCNDINIDPGIPIIQLTGTGLPTPEANISPTTLEETLLCGDSVAVDLVIYNNGQADLTYSLSSFLSDGLILFYPLDGNANDLSEFERHGVVVEAVPSTDRTGNTNNALEFDGTNDYVDIPDGVYFNGDFTVNAWVYETAYSNWSRLFDFGNGSASDNILGVMSRGTTGYYTAEIFNSYYSGGQIYEYSPLPLNQWLMITQVQEGYNTRIYLNGNLLKSGNSSYIPLNVTRVNNYLARSAWTQDAYYKGKIDDFRIYDRALDPSEISDIYQDQTASWFSFSPANGTIAAGDSAIITVWVNASSLFAGDYESSITILTNDPINPQFTVPVVLHVYGSPQIETDNSLLDFGSTMQHIPVDLPLIIRNTGCDNLMIDSFDFTVVEFQLVVPDGPVIIPPHDSLIATIRFLSQDTGTFSGILSIVNDAGNIDIQLTGISGGAPVIGFAPDTSYAYISNCGDSLEVQGIIQNNGLIDLNWSANNQSSGGTALSFDSYGEWVSVGDYGPMPEQGTIEFWMWTNLWQSYNNVFCTNGLGYDNIGIRFEEYSSGQFLAIVGDDYSNYYGFTLSYSIPVNEWQHVAMTWDKDQNKVWFYLNGNEVISEGYCDTWATNWYDFVIGAGYNTDRWWNGLIDEFRIWNYRRSYEQINVSKDLSLTGSEPGLLAYWNFNEGSGNEVYDVTLNGHNGTFTGASWVESTITVSSFVTVSPASGVIAPGESQDVIYLFKAGNNISGQYHHFITVVSNDPLSPAIQHPCTMDIGGFPGISTNLNELYFGDLMVGATMTQSLIIYNTGCDTLVVDSANYYYTDEFFLETLPITILPFDSAILTIRFSPQFAAYFEDWITIYSNAWPIDIFVDGSGIDAPVFAWDPSLIEVTVACSDTVYVPLTIYNNGMADLIFNISGVGSGGSGVPVTPVCTPYTYNYCCGMGIYHVRFNTIDTITNDASDGCKDYTAEQSTVVVPGQTYDIEIQTGPNYSEHVAVWIDYNNNGVFEENENVLVSYYGPIHTGNITIPFDAVMNVPLRMRVAANYEYDGVPTPCSNPYYSQDEDYTVIVLSGIYPPVVNDTLLPFSYESYDIMFSGNNLNVGDYSGYFSITTNDPVNPTVQIPCLLHVSGDAFLTLSENYHDYSYIMVNTLSNYDISLVNDGCDTLFIYNMYSTNDVFTAVLDNYTLYPDESTLLHLTFAPQEVNYFEGDIWLNTNVGDFNVFLVGSGVPAPSILISPDVLDIQLSCGDSTEIPVSVYNDGEGVLHYQVNFHPELDSGLLVYYPFYGNYTDYSGNNRNLTNYGAYLTTGNTGVGYTAYAFEDSATMRYTNTNDIPNLYQDQVTVSLWAKFPDPSTWQDPYPILWNISGYYYNYDGIYIQADATTIYCAFRINYNFYTVSCPIQIDTWMHLAYTYDGNIIKAYVNGELCSEYPISGELYYYTNNPAFIFGNWNQPPGNDHYFTGDLDEFRYYGRALSLDEIAALYSNASYFLDLQANPTIDSVGAYDWHDFILTVKTDGLVAGYYQDVIDITSNDPLHPHTYLPINLEIIGIPEILVSPDCLEYDTIMQFTQQTMNVLIENPSCAYLYVWNLNTGTASFHPEFSNVVIPPFGSNIVPVIFNPQAEGLNEDTLYIDSEAGYYKVCLKGYCTGIPVAVVYPTAVNQVLSCDESFTQSLQIRNEGLAGMEYQVNAVPTIWFSGINVSGTLDPGSETTVAFTFTRTDVPTGLYNTIIPVSSNDPLHPLVNIPVYLLIPNPLVPVNLGSDTGYCTGNTFTLNAGNYASYLWNDGSTGSSITVANPGTYWVDVVDNYNCFSTDTMILTEYPVPTSLAGADTTVCEGTEILLHGNSENTIPPFPLEIKIGTGTQYTSATGPNPFGTYYMDHRSQYLYKHSELIEAGLRAGNITALGFKLNGVGAPGLSNINIRIKTTTANSITSFQGGFTDVYSQSYYYPVINENIFTLDPPFFWNGSTGLIVEVCFDNNSWISNSSYEFTNVQGCVFANFCDNCAPGCSLTGGSAYNERPNLIIHGDGDLTMYHWTGPAGFTSDLRNPSLHNVTLAHSGIYSLTVNNGIGCTDTDELEVLVNPMPAVDAGVDGFILGGESFQFSPSITGGTEPYSYLWSPSLYLDDSSLLQATSTPVFSTTYTLSVTGANGCFNSDQLTVNVIPRFALNGHVTYNNYLYSALEGVKIKVRHSLGTPHDSTYTDQSGNYLFPYLIEGNYLVNASVTMPPGSINATDALKIGKHVVLLEPLSGLPLNAADVNASGKVTGADALLVLHHTVGNISTFPAGDWYFEQKNITIAGADKTQDFIGICYGDVNNSFIPGLKDEPSLKSENEGILSVYQNQSFTLPVRIRNNMSLGAATLNFIIPEKYFKLEEIIMPEGSFTYRFANDIIHIAWNNTDALTLNSNDILLQFKMRRTSLSPPDDFTVTITGWCELADGSAEVTEYQTLLIPKIIEAEVYPDGFYLGQNQPNPFNENSLIPYFLPEEGTVSLEVFNILGELIYLINEGQQSEGQHNIYLSANSIPGGIYYYKMTYRSKSHDLRQTRSLIISK
ncbi:MAG: LamG-like jellyroll fold domain-containing protein [Bacteroidales bacterium]